MADVKARLPQIVIPLVAAAAIAAGRVAADRWPPLPPRSVSDWLPWFAVFIAGVAAVLALADRWWLTWVARVIVFAAVGWLIVRGLVPHVMDSETAGLWAVGVAGLCLIACGALDLVDQHERTGPAATIAPAAAIGFAGLVSIFSAMVTDMMPLLGAMGVFLIAALLGLRWRSVRLGPGGHTFAVAMLAGLLTLVTLYADDRPAGIFSAVVLLSPIAALAARLPGVRHRAWRGLVAAGIAVSIIGAAAVAPLAIDYFAPADQSEQQDNGGYDYGL